MLDLEEKCCRGGGWVKRLGFVFGEGNWANGVEILGGYEKK